MGIYDREYTRVERSSERGVSLFRGHSTLSILIALNVAVFVAWLAVGRDSMFMQRHFMFTVRGLLEHGRVHTLITYAFSHVEFGHILWNMLFLWWFGSELEEMYGPRDFGVLYLFSAVLGQAVETAMVLAGWMSDMPCLGASGSVMGVVVLCAVLYPTRQIYLMGIIPIALKWLAIFFVAGDLVGLIQGMDGIGHGVHLGGALAGLLYYRFDLRIFRRAGKNRRVWEPGSWTGADSGLQPAARPSLWQRLKSKFRRPPRLRVVERRLDSGKWEEFESASRRHPQVDAQTARRVDQLLKKISEQGIQSLDAEERKFLEESSQKYRSSEDGG